MSTHLFVTLSTVNPSGQRHSKDPTVFLHLYWQTVGMLVYILLIYRLFTHSLTSVTRFRYFDAITKSNPFIPPAIKSLTCAGFSVWRKFVTPWASTHLPTTVDDTVWSYCTGVRVCKFANRHVWIYIKVETISTIPLERYKFGIVWCNNVLTRSNTCPLAQF